MAVMLNKPKLPLAIDEGQVSLDGTDLSPYLSAYVIEANEHGARVHMTADVELVSLGLDVEAYQTHPPDWRAAHLVGMKAEDWDAIVMGRPSMGEGSNPGAKIVAFIEQMEPPADSGG